MADERVEAIRHLVAEAEARQLDLEPFLALHTDGAIVVNFGGRRVLGRDALGDAMSQALASPLAQVLTRNEIHDIRFVRPDVALVSCTKHVADERADTGDDAPRFAAKGSLTYVVVEEQGEWRIALAQTTPIAAA